MRGQVMRPQVSFHLDDLSDPFQRTRPTNEELSQQFACDLNGWPVVK
jgi:hypothetical protein